MPFKAGTFDMPTSAGTYEIADIDFEVQGCFFMGGNQSAMDTVISPSNAGAFFGMSYIDVVSGNLDQQGLFNGAPTMFNFRPSAITCAASSGSVQDYRADVVSHNPLVINVTNPAPGFRPIHYLAYGEMEGANGATGASFDNAVLNFTLPYRPSTGLMFHFWPTDAVRDRIGNGGNYFSMGVGNWPFVTDPGPYGYESHSAASAIRVFSQLGAIGYTQQFQDFLGPGHTSLTIRPWVAGSYLTAVDVMQPQPGWPASDAMGIHVHMWGYTTRHHMAWWTGEGSTHFAGFPGLGNTGVYTARPNVPEVEAVLFYGTTGYGDEQLLTPNCAYMFGVLTPEYQGCVAYDLGIGSAPADGTPRYFQSRQYCYADQLPSGVRASSGEIIGNQVHLTGEIENSVPINGHNNMQMFGPGVVDAPGFFRVLPK